MKMTLARALRYKKRVVAKISALETDIQTNNTLMENAEREVDVRATLADREKLVKHLTELKLAMTSATADVFPTILEVAELKSKIAFLQRVPTTHGLQRNVYDEAASIRYVAELRKKEVEQLVVSLQGQIDDLQARIDAHNNSRQVELADLDVAV